MPASKHQLLDDTKIKISSKNWCWLAGIWLCVSKKILQSGIFYYFYAIYFNILISIGLVHGVEPIARFGHSVEPFLELLAAASLAFMKQVMKDDTIMS